MTRQAEPASYRIRPGKLADIAPLLALERSIETAPHWTEADYCSCFEQIGQAAIQRQLFIAESEETSELWGFAIGKLAVFGDAISLEMEAELESVAVAASARRLGIGRSLCLAVQQWATTLGATTLDLEVRAGSPAAIALYRGLGFEPYAARPAYYRDPVEDATLMRLILKQSHLER